MHRISPAITTRNASRFVQSVQRIGPSSRGRGWMRLRTEIRYTEVAIAMK